MWQDRYSSLMVNREDKIICEFIPTVFDRYKVGKKFYTDHSLYYAGCYGSYLFRFKIKENSARNTCKAENDTPEPAITGCEAGGTRMVVNLVTLNGEKLGKYLGDLRDIMKRREGWDHKQKSDEATAMWDRLASSVDKLMDNRWM